MQADSLHCQHCSSSFHRREHYQRHLLTHTKERPFSCTECGQSFARVDALTRHCTTVHSQREGHAEGSGERRRVAQACKPCNLSKLRCDGLRPCSRCHRYGDECFYEERQKRRLPRRSSSSPPPQTKRHQAQAPRTSSQMPSHPPIQESHFQSPIPCQPPITGSKAPTQGPVEYNAMSEDPSNLPALDSYLVGGPGQVTTQATTPLNCQRSLEPRAPNWESLLWFEDLNIVPGLDASIWPEILNPQSSIDRFDNIWLASSEIPFVPDVEADPSQMPTPLTPAALAEIYNRGCSPGPNDQEALEPRHYHPTAIEVDALLRFPDLQQTDAEQIDQEDLAHVQETQQAVVDEVTKLANNLQTSALFPPFRLIRIPSAPILNAWTQLYFEHFHPVFPILHKASFGHPNTHWLLVFTVSAIGAQFSNIPQAGVCSRAMHEMIRRQSMYLCENQNKNGRELWLTQVILLNHIGLRYSGERRALEIAELLQALPVTLARRKHLFTDILATKKLSELDLSLRQRWQLWTLDEERRRTGFAIWLVDSGFETHFDLTPVLSVGELNNSLPRREDPWSASSAGAWASHSLPSDPDSQTTLQQVLINCSWVAAWNRTGILGKQALLQLLTNCLSNNPRHAFLHSGYSISSLDAEGLLKDFLAAIEGEEPGISASERKACGVYRLVILSALMSHNSPQIPLLATAMRIKYQRCSEKEFGELTRDWNDAPQARRRAVLYAARIIESVRSQYCAHFSTPVLLLHATFTLWLYTILDSSPSDKHTTVSSPSVVLGGPGMADSVQEQWVQSGNGRVKLPGIGSISTPDGRKRLLDESILVMHTIRSWRISKIYAQLLGQLKEV